MTGLGDWAWHNTNGSTFHLSGGDYFEAMFWHFKPKVPVPFKRNKHRYGR